MGGMRSCASEAIDKVVQIPGIANERLSCPRSDPTFKGVDPDRVRGMFLISHPCCGRVSRPVHVFGPKVSP